MSKLIFSCFKSAILLSLIILILNIDTGVSAVSCSGQQHSATATSYFPSNVWPEGGYTDCHNKPLNTLEAFLNGQADYVSVAMDQNLNIIYGTPLCIPEINDKYGRNIEFRVVDTGPAFTNTGFSRIDICVDTEAHCYDGTVPTKVTLIFPSVPTGAHCTV